MSVLPLVDELYEAFTRTLPPTLARAAEGLAATLHLVPQAGIPWSQVFQHEIVLAAPALLAPAVPHVAQEVVRQATQTHLLAVVHAFARDRVLDGEAKPQATTLALLDALRNARDAALAEVLGRDGEDASLRYDDDDAERAFADERVILAGEGEADFATYREIARRKQGAAYPATVALACAAGWSRTDLGRVRAVLEGIALGLQMYDDAVDWPKDFARHASWAATVAGASGLPTGAASDAVRASGILPRLVEEGRAELAHAAADARGMKAHAIADWAHGREIALERIAAEEKNAPGYAARAIALGGWMNEVTR